MNFITADNLRIELKAGGLSQQQEDHVIKHILSGRENGQASSCLLILIASITDESTGKRLISRIKHIVNAI